MPYSRASRSSAAAEQAGWECAAAHAERAAELASQALAVDRAAELYQAALRLGAHDDAARRRLRIALGDVLVNAGRGAEAAEVYVAAVPGADAATQLDCQRKAAEQLLISGQVEQGLAAMEALLAAIGERPTRTLTGAFISLLWRRVQLQVRHIRWIPRDPATVPPRELQRVDIYKSAAQGLGFVDPVRGADYQTRGLLLALRTGDALRVGRAIALEVGYVAVQGKHAEAEALLAEVIRIANTTSDDYLQGWVHLVRGMLGYLRGRFRAAVNDLDQVEPHFREKATGPLFELNSGRLFLLFTLRAMGSYRRMQGCFERYIRDAARRADHYMETALRRISSILCLARDDPNEAGRETDRATWGARPPIYIVSCWWELQARVEREIYAGEVHPGSFDAQFEALSHSLLPRIQIVRALSRRLRCRLTLSEADAGVRPRQAVAISGRLARKLERERMPYATVWAQLLRAGVEAQQGHPDRAISWLRASVSGAEASSMFLCAAAGRRRLGQLLGGDEGAALVAQADAWMASEGIKSPARMTALEAPGFGRYD